jgi:predicted O-methyltransferase YrrM
MTTITTPKFSTLTEQLFADNDRTRAVMMQKFAAMSEAQKEAYFGPKAQYREFYSEAKDIHLAVSRETANLVYMLARSANATSIVEFGTSF